MVNIAGNDFVGSGYLATPNSAATGVELSQFIASSGAIPGHINLPVNPSGIVLADGTTLPNVNLPPASGTEALDIFPTVNGNTVFRAPGVFKPEAISGPGMNSPYTFPEGYDPDQLKVDGGKLCGIDEIFGPYEQTRFLGASIVGFNCSIGFGNQSSTLTVNLVEDKCPGHPRTYFCDHRRTKRESTGGTPGAPDRYNYSTDNLLIFNRANLEKKTANDADEFDPPEIGSPVYFRIHNFEFTGILQSWQKLESQTSPEGSYTVQIKDPRDILQGVQVILSNEVDRFTTKPRVEPLWNVWNIYGLLEQLGERCGDQATDASTGFFVPDDNCFGGAELTDEGIPWNYVHSGLIVYGQATSIFGSAGSLVDQDGVDGGPRPFDITKAPWGIRVKDGKYLLDTTDLPTMPSGYRVKGPVTNVLDLISTVCDANAMDFWVECLPMVRNDDTTYTKHGGPPGELIGYEETVAVPSLPEGAIIGPGSGVIPVIKIRTVRRDIQPPLDRIQNFIEQYKASGLVIDSSRGIENITEPTNAAVIGGRRRDIYQCESHYIPPPSWQGRDASRAFPADIPSQRAAFPDGISFPHYPEPYIKSAAIVKYVPETDMTTHPPSVRQVTRIEQFNNFQSAVDTINGLGTNTYNFENIYIGAAAEAILHNSNLPHGIQPFWGLDPQGNAIIGGMAPNPWHQKQWIDEDGDITTADNSPYDKTIVDEEVYTIIVRTDRLRPKLRSKPEGSAGNILQKRNQSGVNKKTQLREWGSHTGEPIHFYPITLTEMRAAKSGFNAWLSLIATKADHPITEAFGLKSDNDNLINIIRILTKDDSKISIGNVVEKIKQKVTGILKLGKDAAVDEDEQLAEKLRTKDLEAVHNFVLTFANRMGRQFLVPLYKDQGKKSTGVDDPGQELPPYLYPIDGPSLVTYKNNKLLAESERVETVIGHLVTRKAGLHTTATSICAPTLGDSYGHFEAGLCAVENPSNNMPNTNIKVVNEGWPESWPHREEVHTPFQNELHPHQLNEYIDSVEDNPDATNTLSPSPSIIMLPFPTGTAFFSQPNGLIEGFCRMPLVDCTNEGKKLNIDISELADEDIFYHQNFMQSEISPPSADGSGVFVRCSYDVEEPNQEPDQNIVYANRDFLKGPFAVATLPAPIKRSVTQDEFDLPLKALLVLLTGDIDGESTGLTKEAIRQLVSTLGIGVDEASLAEEFMVPEAFAVPIESLNQSYGPFITEPTGIAGRTKVIEKSDLVPWNYGGITRVVEAGSGLADSSATLAEGIEIGSVRIPGFPSGAALGFEMDHIGRADGAIAVNRMKDYDSPNVIFGGCYKDAAFGYTRVRTGTNFKKHQILDSVGDPWFDTADYPHIDGSLGPQITNISVTANVNGGVTTQYQFRTFTASRNQQLDKFNLDKLRQDGVSELQDSIKGLKREIEKQTGLRAAKRRGGTLGAILRAVGGTVGDHVQGAIDITKNESIFSQSASNIFAAAINPFKVVTDKIKYDDQTGELEEGTKSLPKIIPGANSEVYSYNRVDTAIEASKDYFSKFFMSLDGLLRPVTMDGGGHATGKLPRYYQSTSDSCSAATHEGEQDTAQGLGIADATTSYYSKRPHPPLVNKDNELESPGQQPNVEGIYAADYLINIDALNPFANPEGIGNRQNPNSTHEQSKRTGHDISILGQSDEEVKDDSLTPLTIKQTTRARSDDYKSAYSEDYRAMAIRGPILLQGWGYDLDGKPIPNEADWSDNEADAEYEMGNAKNGIFKTDELTDEFAPGWLRKSDAWPVAPVDLRFDRERGVWTSPMPFKFVKATLLEDLTEYKTAKALIKDSHNEGTIYDKSGAVIPEIQKVITIQEDIGGHYKKDEILRLYYDDSNCEYRVIHADSVAQTRLEVAVIYEPGSSGGGGGLDIRCDICDDPKKGTAYLLKLPTPCGQSEQIHVMEPAADPADPDVSVAKDLHDVDIDSANLDPDYKIQIINTLNQPISHGMKVIVSKDFPDGCYRVLQAQFCPMVVLTSIYLREDYPCDLDYIYDNAPHLQTVTTCGTFGVCGIQFALNAGGGISTCNHEASTSLCKQQGTPCDPPTVSCTKDGYCVTIPISDSQLGAGQSSDYWYICADTEFCFDIEARVAYPTYPELQFDVSERVIYLQSAYSKPMSSPDRESLDLDLNTDDGAVKVIPTMPTFNNRKEEHHWCKVGTGPGSSAMEDMINTYAATSDLAKHTGNNDTKQLINIADFGFEWQKGDYKHNCDNCCDSYYQFSSGGREVIQHAGGGGQYGTHCTQHATQIPV